MTLIYIWPEKNVVLVGNEQISQKKRKTICTVETIVLSLLSGLRHISIGPDTENYFWMFKKVQNQSWATLFRNFKLGYFGDIYVLRDPGYPIFEKLVQVFTDEYQWLLGVIAILFFVALGMFVYRFSSDPFVSYILFFNLSDFSQKYYSKSNRIWGISKCQIMKK